jgi:hypothetical protein
LSYPIIGQNTKGLAKLSHLANIFVVVEQPENDLGFLTVRDIETGQTYQIFRQQFTPMQNSIPSKFRQHNFEQMTPYWKAALEAFPAPVEIDPLPHTAETIARRLREARKAKEKYKWTSANIDELLWANHATGVDICLTNEGKVVMKPHDVPMPKSNIMAKIESQIKNVIIFSWQDFSDVERLCKLLHERAFNPRPQFWLAGLSKEQVLSLEERYDVGFVEENGKHITI